MCLRDKKNHLDSIGRRQLLTALGGFGATMLLVRCGAGSSTSATANAATDDSSTTGGTTATNACTVTNSEVAGPYPADGSNSAGDGNSTRLDDVYSGSPIIRSNITENLSGVPLDIAITLQDTNSSCAVLSGYYIYIWHCTPGGQYSAYTGSTNGGTHSRTETYLRGIVQTDSNGLAQFQTVYPGWYSGRAVHIHVEVYKNLSDSSTVKTTQMAFPMTVNKIVQATSGYNGASGMMDNTADGIFSDDTTTEMMTMSGNTTNGYTGTLTLRVAA